MVGCWKYDKGTSRFHKMQGIFCLDEELLASEENCSKELLSYVVHLIGWLVSLFCYFILSFFLSFFLPSFFHCLELKSI